MPSSAELQQAIAANPTWYHSIELAPGVVTPGRVDLRRTAAKVLPARLDGQRVLDVGTFDGFWAFEHERRGADVTAIDVDSVADVDLIPVHRRKILAAAEQHQIAMGEGFRIAKEALGARAERVTCSIYDVAPDRIGGPVDRAFIGALLLHLRDPVGAVEAVASCLKPGGTLHVLEPVDVALWVQHPRRPVAAFRAVASEFTWWAVNLPGLHRWLLAAGLQDIRREKVVLPPARWGMERIVYVSMTARAGGS